MLEFLAPHLPIICGVILATAVLIYVLLDGFDLGVGILSGFMGVKDKDTAMASIAPVWDGNETWLVLGGGGFFALFPLAYAILFPAFYAPIILMLLALILRGVAFEFVHRDEKHRKFWDAGFTYGSAVAAFTQGLMLGGFIQGVTVVNGAYAGGWFDWLSPFTVTVGFAVMAGYTLLGATWLVLKTEGPLQKQMRRHTKPLAIVLFLNMAFISLWTPSVHPYIAERWFTLPNMFWLAPLPLAAIGMGLLLWNALEKKHDLTAYLATSGLYLLGFIGLGISMFPYIVPYAVTLQAAANPPGSQLFLLVGILVLLPVILGYTAYTYWLFRGKVQQGGGYGDH